MAKRAGWLVAALGGAVLWGCTPTATPNCSAFCANKGGMRAMVPKEGGGACICQQPGEEERGSNEPMPQGGPAHP